MVSPSQIISSIDQIVSTFIYLYATTQEPVQGGLQNSTTQLWIGYKKSIQCKMQKSEWADCWQFQIEKETS